VEQWTKGEGDARNTKDERDGKNPGEGSKCPWPTLIKVNEVVETIIEKLLILQPEHSFGFGRSSFGFTLTSPPSRTVGTPFYPAIYFAPVSGSGRTLISLNRTMSPGS
jgi:hypothetical protein